MKNLDRTHRQEDYADQETIQIVILFATKQ